MGCVVRGDMCVVVVAMSQAPTAAGVKFLAELHEICALAPGPDKEQRRQDWARRLGAHFSTRRPVTRDWQKIAAGERDEP